MTSGDRQRARRPHTGRRRNEAARQAVLRAAGELLATGQGPNVSVATIADRAGVAKQTIYRWWPSKSAVLLEAMVLRAKILVPEIDTGEFTSDLHTFLHTTFAAAADHRSLLLGALREALTNPAAMSQLAAFTASRRDALSQIIERARQRGEISDATHARTIVDQTFGLLWYRMVFAHAPLDPRASAELAEALLAQIK